jgi:hypothetical protein
MDDTRFWSQSGVSEEDRPAAIAWAEARLEEDRLDGYWGTRGIEPGYPATGTDKPPFAWREAKDRPTPKNLEVERVAVACLIGHRGPWQSGKPSKLSPVQRGRLLTISTGLTEDEHAEVAALVEVRRDSRNTRKRNARSRRAA